MNSTIKNSAIYLFGSTLSKVIGLLLIPFYTKQFSVADYGKLSLLNIIIQLLSFVFLMGISSVAMRLYFDSSDNKHKKSIYATALNLLLRRVFFFTCLSFVILFVVSPFLFPSIQFFPYIVTVIILSSFLPFIKLIVGLFRVEKKPFTFILFNILLFLFQLFLTIFVIIVLKAGVQGVLVSQLIVNVSFALFSIIYIYKYTGFKVDNTYAGELTALGAALIPYFLLTWFSNALPRMFLEHFSGLQAVGIFAVTAQFCGVLLLVVNALDNALLPHFYELSSHDDSKNLLGSLALRYINIISIVALLVLILSPALMKLVVHPRYYAAIDFIPYLILYYWLKSIGKFYFWGFMGNKKSRVLSYFSVYKLLIQFFSLFFVILFYKTTIQSMLYGLMFAEIASLFIHHFFLQKHYYIHFPYKHILVIISLFVFSFVLHLFYQGGVLLLFCAPILFVYIYYFFRKHVLV